MVDILQHIGTQRFYSISEEQVRCHCPFHGGDNETAMVVYLDKGVFKCWSHNCDELVKGSFRKAVAKYGSYQMSSADNNHISVSPKKKVRIDSIDTKDFIPYPEYQILRGLPQSPVFTYVTDVPKYGMQGRAVIFITDLDKQIKGLTGRSLDNNIQPKWKHMMLKDNQHVMFCPHLVDYHQFNTCFIVEGPFDAIKVEHVTHIPTIAVLSDRITYSKAERLVKHFRQVYILADNDANNAGLNGAKKTKEILDGFGVKSRYLLCTKEGHDPADLTWKEILEWISQLDISLPQV